MADLRWCGGGDTVPGPPGWVFSASATLFILVFWATLMGLSWVGSRGCRSFFLSSPEGMLIGVRERGGEGEREGEKG